MHLLILIAFIPLIKGQVANLGKCLDVEPMQNFRKNDFAGRWYMIQRYPNMFDHNFKCITADYSFPEDGIFHQIYNLIKTSDNTSVDLKIIATFVKDDKTAKFAVDVMEDVGDIYVPINLIATDYVNYLVYWGCDQRDNYSYTSSWIFSRKRTLSQEYLDKALEVYKKNGLETDVFTKIDQNNCPN